MLLNIEFESNGYQYYIENVYFFGLNFRIKHNTLKLMLNWCKSIDQINLYWTHGSPIMVWSEHVSLSCSCGSLDIPRSYYGSLAFVDHLDHC